MNGHTAENERGPQATLRLEARRLLNARVAMATGRHNPTEEARAWDRFALALDAAEDDDRGPSDAHHRE